MRFIKNFFKFIFKTILWLVILLLILGTVLYFSSGKLIQYFGPTVISQVTQTPTYLGEVDISLFNGHIALNNLAIGNPAGFKDKNVFELGKLVVDFNPKSVLTDKIIVDSIQISGIQLGMELNAQGKTNAAALMDNVNQSLNSGSSPKKASATAPTQKTEKPASSPTKTVVIRDLTISESAVRTGIAGQIATFSLPTIHQTNIGEGKPQSLAQTIGGILDLITSDSTKAAARATKQAVQDGIGSAKDSINNLTDSIKGLFK